MPKPTQSELIEATGISQPYASMILMEPDQPHSRKPARSLAILIFRKFDWKHPSIAELTEDQMRAFEQVDPWTPREEAA